MTKVKRPLIEGCPACGTDNSGPLCNDDLEVEVRGGRINFITKDGSFSISSDSVRHLVEFIKTLTAARKENL